MSIVMPSKGCSPARAPDFRTDERVVDCLGGIEAALLHLVKHPADEVRAVSSDGSRQGNLHFPSLRLAAGVDSCGPVEFVPNLRSQSVSGAGSACCAEVNQHNLAVLVRESLPIQEIAGIAVDATP